MATLDLKLLKKHVRADDFAEDDDYLTHLLEAAEEYVAQSTNHTVEELVAKGTDGKSLPATLQQAVLLIAGHWYNQREAVAGVQMSEVPYAVQALIKPYRKLVDDKDTAE